MTSGIGYYGETKGNNPVEVIPKLDSINRRSEIGTDVFIYGFKSASDWETEITVALLESFLMSFFNEQLRVKVQGREIIKNHYQDIWNVFIENAQVQLKELMAIILH